MDKWYVLSVLTDKELEVSNRLNKMCVKNLVPVQEKLLRKNGEWKKEKVVIFKGYVFIKVNYSWGLYYSVTKQIKSVINILGGGKEPIALSNEEIKRIEILNKFQDVSKVTFKNGKFKVISGVLKEFDNSIITVKRRQKRAKLGVEIGSKIIFINASFEEV